MAFSVEYLPYSATKAFSQIAVDFTETPEKLVSLFGHRTDLAGIEAAISARKNFATDRTLLVEQLTLQYRDVPVSGKVLANIQALLRENTFTITTAHQPNIFTGHLYFIYKILHTIKLAEQLSIDLPGNNFVPVYYMGSEDADLEELGEVTINGSKYTWETTQTGAVGRMKIDKGFMSLLDAIEGQLAVEPYGKEVIALLRKTYAPGKTIQAATFELVNDLFADFGLVILLPDNASFKRSFAAVIQRELVEQFSHKAVAETMTNFPAEYKLQAAGREINLFYLQEDSRERIKKTTSKWSVLNTDIVFEDGTILQELEKHPERFSPNVILRPVFQEMILPNIVFVGGGGELAYWLELKKVFEAVDVPYPVMVLRNSFMLVPAKQYEKMASLQMQPIDFFQSSIELEAQVTKKYSNHKLSLADEHTRLRELYEQVGSVAGAIDPTLTKHASALHATAAKKLEQLEKKMLKAEKKKFEAKLRQLDKIKQSLFPNGNLQERVDNFMPYYAKYGRELMQVFYQHSLALEQQFCVLTEEV